MLGLIFVDQPRGRKDEGGLLPVLQRSLFPPLQEVVEGQIVAGADLIGALLKRLSKRAICIMQNFLIVLVYLIVVGEPVVVMLRFQVLEVPQKDHIDRGVVVVCP